MNANRLDPVAFFGAAAAELWLGASFGLPFALGTLVMAAVVSFMYFPIFQQGEGDFSGRSFARGVSWTIVTITTICVLALSPSKGCPKDDAQCEAALRDRYPR